MKNLLLSVFLVALATAMTGRPANGQNAILAEMYGRGVHAYNAGRYDDATQLLSMAINNGIQDPRAFYFRGIVAHAQGRSYEAEADWQQGADMEAAGRTNPAIGRSLARFQGAARIKLEGMRQKAKLQFLSNAAARSKQRYGELGAAPDAAAGGMPTPAPRAAAPPPPPPPPPAGDDDDPFADDMAQGQPSVQADDALEGAMDPIPTAPDDAGGAAPAADGDPFGGGGDNANPFGGGDDGANPFGGDAGGDADNPFGGGDAGGDDNPFGGNPFGS